MKTSTKKAAKRGTRTAKKPRAKTTAEKLGQAVASTANFAAGLARDLAATVTKRADDAAPRATDLLVQHHRKLEKLFARIEDTKKGLNATLRELADDLSAHIAIEERLFYPAVRKLNPEIVLEGLEEHAMGRFALRRVLGTKASDASLQIRLKALKELMTNHHHEEEEDLFKVVQRKMSNDALEKLGARMKQLFDTEVARGHEAVLATFDDQLHKPVRAKTQKPTKR